MHHKGVTLYCVVTVLTKNDHIQQITFFSLFKQHINFDLYRTVLLFMLNYSIS